MGQWTTELGQDDPASVELKSYEFALLTSNAHTDNVGTVGLFNDEDPFTNQPITSEGSIGVRTFEVGHLRAVR